MKIIKFVIIIALAITPILTTACDSRFGNISICPETTVIDGSTFDTKHLRLIQADTSGEINYAVKVIGKTKPLNDQSWNKWFGDEECDVVGKIAVALRLEYIEEIITDSSSSITISAPLLEPKTYLLSELPNKQIDSTYIYLILNPRYDIVTINLDYTIDNEHRDITYTIDMINVNTDSSRLE